MDQPTRLRLASSASRPINHAPAGRGITHSADPRSARCHSIAATSYEVRSLTPVNGHLKSSVSAGATPSRAERQRVPPERIIHDQLSERRQVIR